MSDERPPNKRQQQAAATRERVLRAATEVFEQRGYRATTVGAITEAADTAHGTFYLYFKNKDDALMQVVNTVGDDMVVSVAAAYASDPWEMCRGTLLAFLEVFEEHGGLWKALLEGTFHSPEIREDWERRRGLFVGGISTAIEQEQTEGRMLGIDAQQYAVALGSMAEWYAFTYLVVGSLNENKVKAVDAVDSLATVWYRALYGVTDRDV